ncbi:MAG: hypothetical protein AAFO72_11300 [Pseudomonadota bacterium]
MDPSVTEMHRLHRQILSMEADKRHIMQPQLDMVIARTRQAGESVPHDIAQLNITLMDEAIEAQFDNLPV